MFCSDKPILQSEFRTSKPKTNFIAAKQRRRNVRQIQDQLDSLRARERASFSRNSALLADISRLKKQVQNMNVSVNRLERARDYYDRYVETCMVTWIQKAFRETGTEERVDSGNKHDFASPTKTIGVQTTHDHSTTQISDWSISPDSERQLMPPMQSTMILPNAATQPPPRDTRPHPDASSCVPSVINLSDLVAPSVPLQDTFVPPDPTLSVLYSHGFATAQAAPTALPFLQAAHASPLPTGLPPPHPLVPQMLPPGLALRHPYMHPTAFHSPNVSMVTPHTLLAVPHSYASPQQPVAYPNLPIYPNIPTPHHSIDTSLPPAPQQPLMPTGMLPPSADNEPISHTPSTEHSPVESRIQGDPPEATPMPPTRPLEDCVLPATSLQTLSLLHLTQPLRHSDTIPTQSTKPAPPPPRHSLHSPSKQVAHSPEPQLSHSRQSSTLPTIPEPNFESGELTPVSAPQSDTEPLVRSASNTPVGMRRVPSAYEFALHHLENLEKRATLDLGDRSGSEAGPHQANSLDTGSQSRGRLSSSQKSDTDADSEGSGRDKFSHLKSTPNQFDLTALLVSESGSEEELRHKPSQVMSEPVSGGLTVLRNLAATLNTHCPAATRLYDTIPAIDTLKPQIESGAVANRILSQADTSDMAQLASWDVRTLSAVFLSEVSKYVLLSGPVLTPEILSRAKLDLDTFNRALPLGSQEVWHVLVGHFVSLFEANYSVEFISATFATHLVTPLSTPDTVELATGALDSLLRDLFEERDREEQEPSLSSTSSSNINSEPREEVYQQLLKSVTVDDGVKSGLVSPLSSLASGGSEGGQLEEGVNLVTPGATSKVADLSPTQLLDQAVGEKIPSDESSGTESVEEGDIYVPSFGPPKPMSDRDRKIKFEKFWGSDLDSDESEGPAPAVKRKPSYGLDEFDFS